MTQTFKLQNKIYMVQFANRNRIQSTVKGVLFWSMCSEMLLAPFALINMYKYKVHSQNVLVYYSNCFKISHTSKQKINNWGVPSINDVSLEIIQKHQKINRKDKNSQTRTKYVWNRCHSMEYNLKRKLRTKSRKRERENHPYK